MIHVYTGNGKGKTTAALGLAIRAAGWEKKVAIVFFDKGGDEYGERKTLDKLSDSIDYFAFGMNRIDEQGTFRMNITEKDREEARKAFKKTQELIKSNKYEVIILDEINSVLVQNITELNDCLQLLETIPKTTEIICTGRNCPEALLNKADMITEMKAVKHYFDTGIKARKGIEM